MRAREPPHKDCAHAHDRVRARARDAALVEREERARGDLAAMCDSFSTRISVSFSVSDSDDQECSEIPQDTCAYVRALDCPRPDTSLQPLSLSLSQNSTEFSIAACRRTPAVTARR